MLFRWLLVLSFSLFSANASAALFKCTDPNGKVAFSDRPCEGDSSGDDIEDALPPINASTPSSSVTRKQSSYSNPTPTLPQAESQPETKQVKQNNDALCRTMRRNFDLLTRKPSCPRSKFKDKIGNCTVVRDTDSGKKYGKIKQEKYRKKLKKRIDRLCS